MRLLTAVASVFVLAAASGAARADGETAEGAPASPVPTTSPPTQPGSSASTTVVAPPGSGGVTVVAPTPGGGTVTASGCSTVVVNGSPTLIGPGGMPCPAGGPAPYPNYAPYAGGPYAAPPPTMPYYDVRPKYAPDPDRKAAQIGASIGFGVGGGVAGIMYLVQYSEARDRCSYGRYVQYSDGTSSYEKDDSGCTGAGSRASLITYGAIVTFLPSLPRFVVGDTTRGLIYTGLRGASVLTAALVNWGDDGDTRWQGPFLLGFVAPVTLGIIDLATTPHREDLAEKEKAAMRKPGINGIMPIAMTEKNGTTHGAMVSLQGRF